MSDFRPDGYLPTWEALWKAAESWMPERWAALLQVAATLSSSKPKDNSSTNFSSLELAAHIFSQSPIPPAWQDDNWRREFERLLTYTAHRLRNLLHQGQIKAYYFDDNGRQEFTVDFWLTPVADGMLESGTYFPFGPPNAWHEPPRPAYRLFLKQSDLNLLLSQQLDEKRTLPGSKVSALAAALHKFDHLPNRKEQREAVRKLTEFARYKITDKLFREAEKQMPRAPGRKPASEP